MVLVDTSVWVEHLRHGNIRLEALLNDSRVVCHPFIIGELACGNLKNRAEVLSLLHALPMAISVEHEETMQFIENHLLMGKGLGYIDIHLLMSTITATMARKKLYRLIDEVEESHEAIRISGKRSTAVIVSESDWSAIQETLYLLTIQGMGESIRKGLKTPVEKCSKDLRW